MVWFALLTCEAIEGHSLLETLHFCRCARSGLMAWGSQEQRSYDPATKDMNFAGFACTTGIREHNIRWKRSIVPPVLHPRLCNLGPMLRHGQADLPPPRMVPQTIGASRNWVSKSWRTRIEIAFSSFVKLSSLTWPVWATRSLGFPPLGNTWKIQWTAASPPWQHGVPRYG